MKAVQKKKAARREFANAASAARPRLRTRGEGSISTERVTQSVRMRFNPLRGLTPDRLSQYLDQFDIGFFRNCAITWDKIERRDYRIKVVAPKRKKAVARHGYDVVSMDKLEESERAMAEAQVKALKYFYDNLTCTNAIRPDEQGGLNLLVRQMMDAHSKYYAVHEVVWQVKDASEISGAAGTVAQQLLTAQFVFCPLWWFEGVTGKLRYMDSEFQVYGRDMAPGEWLVTVGEGLMEACSVAWMFKNLSLQDWVAFCEKFGQPFIDAATSASPGSEDWDNLKEYVANFGPDGGGVRSDTATLNLVESKASGSDAYQGMVENMDRALTILWRGGDLGTSGGKDVTGASLQGDESDILEGDDSVGIEETLAIQISRVVIEWTFGVGTPVLAYLKFRQEQDPELVTFQREVFKAFAADGTVVDVLANLMDLKKLVQDVNLPVNEEAVDPYLSVSNRAGQAETGNVTRDSEGDIVGGSVAQGNSNGETRNPNQTANPNDPKKPNNARGGNGKPDTVIENDKTASAGKPDGEPADLEPLEESGIEHYARAVAEDLKVVAEECEALLKISDDRVLAQRAVALGDRIEQLKADILHLPKAAQALAEVQIAALFSGLTENSKKKV